MLVDTGIITYKGFDSFNPLEVLKR